MTFIVKICGNKPADFPGLFEVIAHFREEQLRVFGEHKIDLRAGILVGQKHPSPDFVSLSETRHIIRDAPPESMVVVTHLDTITELIDLVGETEQGTVQLHGKHPSPEHVEELKTLYPDRPLWHVMHAPHVSGVVAEQAAWERRAVTAAHELIIAGAEAIVLDTYDPLSGRVGGTGMSVGGNQARRFRDAFKTDECSGQLVLAGGLKPSNVVCKIRSIRPDGIDANTGLNVSTEDRSKDPGKVKAFFEEALLGAYGTQVSSLWIAS